MFLPRSDFPWTRELEAGFPEIILDVVKPGETFDDDTPGRDLLIDYFRSG
jgi:hypothetical protein